MRGSILAYAEELMGEAEGAYSKSLEEFEDAARRGDSMLLRDACEKGWLAVVKSTDALIIARGYQPPKSAKERRGIMEELERKEGKIMELGLCDRYAARERYLHELGFYDGVLEIPEIERELKEKVRRYLDDVLALIKPAS